MGPAIIFDLWIDVIFSEKLRDERMKFNQGSLVALLCNLFSDLFFGDHVNSIDNIIEVIP